MNPFKTRELKPWELVLYLLFLALAICTSVFKWPRWPLFIMIGLILAARLLRFWLDKQQFERSQREKNRED